MKGSPTVRLTASNGSETDICNIAESNMHSLMQVRSDDGQTKALQAKNGEIKGTPKRFERTIASRQKRLGDTESFTAALNKEQSLVESSSCESESRDKASGTECGSKPEI